MSRKQEKTNYKQHTSGIIRVPRWNAALSIGGGFWYAILKVQLSVFPRTRCQICCGGLHVWLILTLVADICRSFLTGLITWFQPCWSIYFGSFAHAIHWSLFSCWFCRYTAPQWRTCIACDFGVLGLSLKHLAGGAAVGFQWWLVVVGCWLNDGWMMDAG